MFCFLSKKVAVPGGKHCLSICWLHELALVACGCTEGLLTVFSTTPPSPEQNAHPINFSLTGHTLDVLHLSWAPSKRVLASADSGGQLCLRSFHCTVNPEGRLLSPQWSAPLVIDCCAAASGKQSRGSQRNVITAVRWDPAGGRVAVSNDKGGIQLRKGDNGELLWAVDLKCIITSLEWDPLGRWVVSVLGRSAVRCIASVDGSIVKQHIELYCQSGSATTEDAAITSIAWATHARDEEASSRQRRCLAIATVGGRGQLMLDERDTSPLLFEAAREVHGLKWDSQGEHLASWGCSARGKCHLQILTSAGELLMSLPVATEELAGLSWDSGGHRIALNARQQIFIVSVKRPMEAFLITRTLCVVERNPKAAKITFGHIQSNTSHSVNVKQFVCMRTSPSHALVISECLPTSSNAMTSSDVYTATLYDSSGNLIRMFSLPSKDIVDASLDSATFAIASKSTVAVTSFHAMLPDASFEPWNIPAAPEIEGSSSERRANSVGHLMDLEQENIIMLPLSDRSPPLPSEFKMHRRISYEALLHEESGDRSKLPSDTAQLGESTQKSSSPTVRCVAVKGELLCVILSGNLACFFRVKRPSAEHPYIATVPIDSAIRSVQLNCEGSRMSVLTVTHDLAVFSIPRSTLTPSESNLSPSRSKPIASHHLPRLDKIYERQDVWRNVWSADTPHMLAFSSKQRTFLLRDNQPEELYTSESYIALLENSTLFSIDSEKLHDANRRSSRWAAWPQLVSTHTISPSPGAGDFDPGILSRSGSPASIQELGMMALRRGQIEFARKAFANAGRWSQKSTVRHFVETFSPPGQQPSLYDAHVAALMDEWDEAEQKFCQLGRLEEFVELLRFKGQWGRVLEAAKKARLSASSETVLSAHFESALRHLQDGDIAEAQEHLQKIPTSFAPSTPSSLLPVDHMATLRVKVSAAISSEDLEALKVLAKQVNLSSLAGGMIAEEEAGEVVLLKDIAFALWIRGEVDEAVSIWVKGGAIREAIERCIAANNWERAVDIAKEHHSHRDMLGGKSSEIFGRIKAEVLRRMESSWKPEGGRCVWEAVELLDRMERPLEGASLVFRYLNEQASRGNPPATGSSPRRLVDMLRASVALAFLLLRHTRSIETASAASSSVEHSNRQLLSVEAAANNSLLGSTTHRLPTSQRGGGGPRCAITGQPFTETCRIVPIPPRVFFLVKHPWRYSAGWHLASLSLSQYYCENYTASFCSSLRLREYDDVVPHTISYSLIASSAYALKMLKETSRALSHLETMEDLPRSVRNVIGRIALEIFRKDAPVDPRTSTVPCPECSKPVAEYLPRCCHCFQLWPYSMTSGRSLIVRNTAMLTAGDPPQAIACRQCQHIALVSELDQSKQICLVCHYPLVR